jgi:hypothetical protein
MRAIVNVGIGGDYPRKTAVLRSRCLQYPDGSDLMSWFDTLPPGCPPHGLSHQYAFKLYAMESAFSAAHNPVLWMDSTFRPRASMEPLWREIEETGWYVGMQGDSVLGGWCTDRALGIYGIDRATARSIPLVLSGLVGLDTRHPVGAAIWSEWNRTYIAGAWDGPHKAAHGPIRAWGNKTEGFCSPDKRVEGHRHDESALSFVLWKLGLRPKSLGFTVIDGGPEAPVERNFV